MLQTAFGRRRPTIVFLNIEGRVRKQESPDASPTPLCLINYEGGWSQLDAHHGHDHGATPDNPRYGEIAVSTNNHPDNPLVMDCFAHKMGRVIVVTQQSPQQSPPL